MRIRINEGITLLIRGEEGHISVRKWWLLFYRLSFAPLAIAGIAKILKSETIPLA